MSNPGGETQDKQEHYISIVFSCVQEDDRETRTDLLHNVAEVCSKDVVDIDHSVTDVWKLTHQKKKEKKK